MTTSPNRYSSSVIPAKTGISEAATAIERETPACVGMTTNCQSRSLIYKPARKDTMVGDENGGSLVEFALIAPLLFVILFGIIEFGVLLYDMAMLTNASREGARAGIVYDFNNAGGSNHPNDATIIQRVQDYCQDHLISFSNDSPLTVDIKRMGPDSDDPSGFSEAAYGDAAGDRLNVTVSYRFAFLVFSNVLALIGGDISESLNLEAETVMRME